MDKLECPICLEHFKNSRILPCGHTYCELCLKTILHNSTLICPECSQTHTNILIQSLPRNFVLDKLIDSHKAQNDDLGEQLINIELRELAQIPEKPKKIVQKREEIKIEDPPQARPYYNNEEFFNRRNLTLVDSLCVWNCTTIVILMIVNLLAVSFTQVVVGQGYRIASFFWEYFADGFSNECMDSMLEWQLSWFLTNLFMSSFACFRVWWVYNRIKKCFGSVLFYSGFAGFGYMMYDGYRTSFFGVCGGDMDNFKLIEEEIMFFVELVLNCALGIGYVLAFILGFNIRA